MNKRQITAGRWNVGLLVLLLSAPAMSNTIFFTHTTASTSAPYTDTFTLNGFNTALGTLTGVSIIVDFTITGEVVVQNTLATSQVFTNAMSSVPLTLTAPSGSTATNAATSPLSGTAAVGTSAFRGLTGSGSLDIIVLPSSFSLYEVPVGLYDVSDGPTSVSGTAASGVFFSGPAANVGEVTTVEYTYSPVPLPASAWLLLGGLGGLVLLGRMRTS